MEKEAKSTKEMLERSEKAQKSVNHLGNKKILFLVVVIFIIFDAITIHSIVGKVFNQEILWIPQEVISIIITLGIAILLDGIPVIIAYYILLERKSRFHIAVIISLVLAFLMLFGIIFCLRLSDRSDMVSTRSQQESDKSRKTMSSSSDTSETLENSESSSTKTESDNKTSKTEWWSVVLLGFTPLATSILSFGLAYTYKKSDERKEKICIDRIRFNDRIKALEICKNELYNEQDRELNQYDKKLYDIAKRDLESYEKILKYEVRQKLAIHLATPDAVSKLLEKEEE